MVFHWSLSDSKSPQVSRTHLKSPQVSRTHLKSPGLIYAVVWIVSTRPPTSKSSRPFNNPLVIVPNAPITIGTIVTFMFHSFFNSRLLLLLLHYLDANKTAGVEATRQLHKNVANNIEQVLAATPHKEPTIRPPASHHENYPS